MKNISKTLQMAVVALVVFTFSSCEELEKLNKFDFDLEDQFIDVEVDPLEVGAGIVIGSEKFEKSITDIIKENAPEADLSKIKEIKLTNVSLQIVSGADADNNFQNLTNIYARVNATGMGENGLLVAQKSNIKNERADQLDLPVQGGGVDVTSYFNKTNFEYILKADVRKATTKVMTVRIKADYSFVFKII